MENDPSQEKLDTSPKPTAYSAEARKTAPRKSFVVFLIDSKIRPLEIVGRCIDYFGLAAVLGFFLGAAALYGYALFRPLPYAAKAAIERPPATPSPTPLVDRPARVTLQGFVTTVDSKPVSDFYVAVLENPVFGKRDGSFRIGATRNDLDQYMIAVWVDATKAQLCVTGADENGKLDGVFLSTGPVAGLSSLGTSHLNKPSEDPATVLAKGRGGRDVGSWEGRSLETARLKTLNNPLLPSRLFSENNSRADSPKIDALFPHPGREKE